MKIDAALIYITVALNERQDILNSLASWQFVQADIKGIISDPR